MTLGTPWLSMGALHFDVLDTYNTYIIVISSMYNQGVLYPKYD